MGDQYSASSSSSPERVKPLAVAPADPEMLAATAPIISSYNDHIRPLLDAIDKLRLLSVMKEGIQLPTIVVVGDQSSGKSSVLESLAGIHLPRGQGICTRVPLIMRLQNLPIAAEPELFLEYGGKRSSIKESNISEAINLATYKIAGKGKGISNPPLTLVVRKKGVPDLTMVDLPGITRVPVHDQPENIYEQITEIIMEYIKPEESIILNVLSATDDFTTCESIRMSKQVDRSGQRTLAVVTKADKSPEGLLEKVSSNDVNIGLGYVCVRNRIGDESFEGARMEEEILFETHPLLSQIDKSIVGIPVLAEKLVQIQANIISKCLPTIVKSIDEKLSANVLELEKMPKALSAMEAMAVFMQIVGSAKESLRNNLLRAGFDEFPGEKDMHGSGPLVEILNKFYNDHNCDWKSEGNFLEEEIKFLKEDREFELPDSLSRSAFHRIFRRKLEKISSVHAKAIFEQIWSYIEKVAVSILKRKSDDFPQLKQLMMRAAQSLISQLKERFMARIMEMIEMEKLTDYTCNPDYMSDWTKLVAQKQRFISDINSCSNYTDCEGFGQVYTGHLRYLPDTTINQALELKIRIFLYWKIVLKRLVDSMALHLKFSLHNLISKEFEKEIMTQLIGTYGTDKAIQLILESPEVTCEREQLKSSIVLLRESKEVVTQMMDRIAHYGN